MKRIIKIIKNLIVAVVLLFSVITILRFFAFDVYYVPSESMDTTIKPGEYIFTNKLMYGARWFGKDKMTRLPSLSEVKRNDIVVFNFPEGDTVFVDSPTVNYYQVKQSKAYNKENSEINGLKELTYLPVQNRIAYVKRCIGLPGDTLKVVDGIVYCNQSKIVDKSSCQYRYRIKGDINKIPQIFNNYGVSNYWRAQNTDSIFAFIASSMVVDKIQKENVNFKVYRFPTKWTQEKIFPEFKTVKKRWKYDVYGPIIIPKQGDTITLNEENISIYKRIIETYENNKLTVDTSGIYINDIKTEKYIIKQNYYFMMGDNRNSSIDSRSWGFVPADHIIGKAQFIAFSKNGEEKARWDRFLKILE